MRHRIKKNAGIFLTCIIFTGCATFQPRLRFQDITSDRTPTVKEARDGLEISVEEFVSADKSRQAFDANISPYGVMALLLGVHNKGSKSYKVQQTGVTVSVNHQRLTTLSGDQAADLAATSEYVGKALLWTAAIGPFAMIFWPATIASSASHTQSINQKIRNHFKTIEFYDTTIMPGQKDKGFLYYRLPDNVKNLGKVNMEVKLIEEQTKKELLFAFALPPFELSSPVTTQVATNEEKGQH